MDKRVYPLATKVIELAGTERPADAVLRVVIRDAGHVGKETAAALSKTVFGYYRWRGFLTPGRTMEHQLHESEELARRFTEQPSSFSDEDLQRAVPEWVFSEMEVTTAWLRSLQAEPTLWLRARVGNAARITREIRGAIHSPHELAPEALRYAGPLDLFKSPAFQKGLFEIQDIASQAVGTLCAPRHGDRWWDTCAGEGGKTMHLCDLMENKGTVWATDRAEWRLKQLRIRARRAQIFNFRVALWDGGTTPPAEGRCNGILIDAPCSGIGTWQRNPHARWTTSPKDLHELAAIQLSMLNNVVDALKPGGRIVYSVCTLSRAETTAVANAFTAAHPDFEPLLVGTGSGAATQRWIWPQDLGGNGMFIAAWKKKKTAAEAVPSAA